MNNHSHHLVKAVALFAIAFISLLTQFASAEVMLTTKIDGITYLMRLDGTASSATLDYIIVYSGHEASGNVEIQSSISIEYDYWDVDLQARVSKTFSGPVTEINQQAFNNNDVITGVDIPSSIKLIGGRAFMDCDNLTQVAIPNTITSIGDEAFSQCSNLKKAIIGNNVTIVPSHVFFYCNSLEEVTIGSSVTQIDVCAFVHCPKLRTINCLAPNPPVIGEYTFDNDIYQKAALNIPPDSYNLYREAEYWKLFFEKPGDVNSDSKVSIADVTAIIDYLMTLNASGINLSNADMDGDGVISITDVSTIIDDLLAAS